MPSFARVGCYGEESSGMAEGGPLSGIEIYLTGNEHFEGIGNAEVLICDWKFDTNFSFGGKM